MLHLDGAVEHFDANTGGAFFDYPELLSRRVREINDTVLRERPAVDDRDFNRLPVAEICHADARAERQRPMRRCEIVLIVASAAGAHLAVKAPPLPGTQAPL